MYWISVKDSKNYALKDILKGNKKELIVKKIASQGQSLQIHLTDLVVSHTRFFIHMSRDQPSTHEFTKYMGQQSLARHNVSALCILLGQSSVNVACWHHPFLQIQKLLLYILFIITYCIFIEFNTV